MKIGDLIYDCGTGLKGIILDIDRVSRTPYPFVILYEPFPKGTIGHIDCASPAELKMWNEIEVSGEAR